MKLDVRVDVFTGDTTMTKENNYWTRLLIQSSFDCGAPINPAILKKFKKKDSEKYWDITEIKVPRE